MTTATAAGGGATASVTAAPGGSNAAGFAASGVTIQADAANNALLVMASEPLYNNIRAVVDKLDVRRAQIYVEALVVEVSADKAAEFGIQWNILDANKLNNGATQVGGGTNFGTRGTGTNIIDAQANLGSLGQGLNLGVIRGTINIPGLGIITNLALLARALGSDANTNILSTPNLLTLDNEQASIIVAENVPFITGQYAQTGTTATVTPFQTIERKDVGPHPQGQAADHRRRQRQADDLRGSLAHRRHDQRRRHHYQQALARIDGDGRRRPDHRPRRADPGLLSPTARTRFRSSATSRYWASSSATTTGDESRPT